MLRYVHWEVMRTLTICIALWAASGLHAQNDELSRLHTCGYLNGRYWGESLNEYLRIAYLSGVQDMAGRRDEGFWPQGATLGEVKQALDQFYQDPANLRIAILDAITVVRMRFQGINSKFIEAETETLRRQAAICSGVK